MKYLSLGCVALFLTIGATAQPPDPTNLFCPDSSDWNGYGIPTSDAGTIQNACACEVYAGTGYYLYHDGTTYLGDAISPDPICVEGTINPSYNQSYGLKMKGSISNPSGVFLDMDVFETQFSTDPAYLQSINDNIAYFNGGKFRFKTFFITTGTEVHILPGTELEITDQLMIMGGKLVIYDGATVTLTADANHTAYIDVLVSTLTTSPIEGRITKQVYLTREANVPVINENGDKTFTRYAINPGLYDVNMHELAQQVQTALQEEFIGGSVVKPEVQIGTWGNEDEIESYPFFANNKYADPDGDPIPFYEVGVANHNFNGYNSVPEFVPSLDGYMPISNRNNYLFNRTDGSFILPIYTDADPVMETFLADTNFLGFANGEITATDAQLDQWSTTSLNQMWRFIISIHGGDISKDEWTLNITGRYAHDPVTISTPADTRFKFRNYWDSGSEEVNYPGLTATYLAPTDTVFSSTYLNMPLLDASAEDITLANGTVFPGIYSQDFGYGSEDANFYRWIPMNGLSMLENHTGNYIRMYALAHQIHSAAPNASLTFYDPRMLVPEPKVSSWSEWSQGLATDESMWNFSLPITNAFIPIQPGDGGTYLVDIYNIVDVPIVSAIGDTLSPSETVAYNFNNAVNAEEFLGQGLTVDNYQTGLRRYWQGGNQGATAFASTTLPYVGEEPAPKPDHEIHGVSAAFNSINPTEYLGFNPGQTADTPNMLQDWDTDDWNNWNKFTLLRLRAVTQDDDTVGLAVLPLAFGPEYSAYTLDPFESAISPHPAFHLRTPYLSDQEGNMNDRMWGAYARGYNEAVDSLHLIVNTDYYSDFDFQEFLVDAPIRQLPTGGLPNGPWHWLVGESNPYGSGKQPAHPDFLLSIDPASDEVDYGTLLDEPAQPASGSTEATTGKIITLYPCPVAGDINWDGQCTTADLLVMLGLFGNPAPEPGGPLFLDFNGDDDITTADLVIMLSQFNVPGCIGPNAGSYGTPEFTDNVQERIKVYIEDFDNEHIVYDWVSNYPGFTTQQRLWFQTLVNVAPAQIFVTDEMGWVVYQGSLEESISDGIQLDSRYPTSAELVATNTGTGATNFPTEYHIEIRFPIGRSGFPGSSEPIRKLCLGCKDPNSQFTTAPIFTAN